MSTEQQTAESVLKKLEDEVAAFKTSQPFYDGQFTTREVVNPNTVYDITFVTNKATTAYDMTITNIDSAQPNMIFEPYFEFFLTNNTPLTINNVNYLSHYEAYDSGTSKLSVVVNVTVYGLPIGTTIGVKLFYLVSATVTSGNLSASVRP